MSKKTHDEKLRILQDRLAQIRQKQETPAQSKQQREDIIDTPIDETTKEKKTFSTTMSFGWLKYVVIISILGYGLFFAYNIITSPEEKSKEFLLEYNLNMSGDNIVIVASLDNESSAKALVNDLKVKGFKTNYFFLPNKSNSSEEVFQVFIGPYENKEETNQWSDNLHYKYIQHLYQKESDFKIIQL